MDEIVTRLQTAFRLYRIRKEIRAYYDELQAKFKNVASSADLGYRLVWPKHGPILDEAERFLKKCGLNVPSLCCSSFFSAYSESTSQLQGVHKLVGTPAHSGPGRRPPRGHARATLGPPVSWEPKAGAEPLHFIDDACVRVCVLLVLQCNALYFYQVGVFYQK